MLKALQRATLRRQMATLSPSQAMQPYMIFDRNAKCKQKDKAALKEGGSCSRLVDYVRDEVAERMMERLLVCIC
jgi:NADH dehydrogenase [ubiquinone] 1 alpha subcomplex assembly factor 5